jgi:regulatory protein
MSSPYLDALRMLARRELSEAQIRQRLARKEHDADEIDAAVARLKEERAIDDVRVAQAIARTETNIKRRGKIRVRRTLEGAGISADVTRAALDATFAELDDDALLQAALGRRLRGDRPIADDREFQRLYRYLSTQGFESDRILRALTARRGRTSRDRDDVD